MYGQCSIFTDTVSAEMYKINTSHWLFSKCTVAICQRLMLFLTKHFSFHTWTFIQSLFFYIDISRRKTCWIRDRRKNKKQNCHQVDDIKEVDFLAIKKQRSFFGVCAFSCHFVSGEFSLSAFFKMFRRGPGMLAPSTGKHLNQDNVLQVRKIKSVCVILKKKKRK